MAAIEDLDLEFEDEEEIEKSDALEVDVDLDFGASVSSKPKAPPMPKPKPTPQQASNVQDIRSKSSAPKAVPKSAPQKPQAKPQAKPQVVAQEKPKPQAKPQIVPQAKTTSQIVQEPEVFVDSENSIHEIDQLREEIELLKSQMNEIQTSADVKVAVAEAKSEFLIQYISDAKLMDHQVNQVLSRVLKKVPALKNEIHSIKKYLADFLNNTKK